MIGELFQKAADMLNTDIQTLYRSVFIGTTSTGAVEVVKVANTGWNLSGRSIDLVWAILTCIILTAISFIVTECLKQIKKNIVDRRKEK